MDMEVEVDLPALDQSLTSPIMSTCSTPPLPRTPGSPEFATPPSTPFAHHALTRGLYSQFPSPSLSPSPSPLGRIDIDVDIDRRAGVRDETSRFRFHSPFPFPSPSPSPSGLRSDSLNPSLSPGPVLKRPRLRNDNLYPYKIHRTRFETTSDHYQDYPKSVSVGVEFGLSPGRGGCIAPAFYRGATAPVTISLEDRLAVDTSLRIRSVLKCELHAISSPPEILCRNEQWHDANPQRAGTRSGSGLIKDGYQTLELVIPTSHGSYPSHESDGTGLFTVRWTLDIELYATYSVYYAFGQREILIGSSTRNLTVLPSTAPSPVVLQDPIELRPQGYTTRDDGIGREECEVEGTTVQVRLESTTYSPNSLVPLQLGIRVPQGSHSRSSDSATSSAGLMGLGIGMNTEEEEEEEWLEIQTNLIREQRITHQAPPSSLQDLQNLQDGHGPPTHEVLTRHDIGIISSTLPIPTTTVTVSPTSGGAQMVYHQQTFHLASRDGIWPYGYSTSIRSGNGLTTLSNSFVLETRTSQYRRYRQHQGSSLITHSVGYRSIPIIIGSVSEPRDAMYQSQAQPHNEVRISNPDLPSTPTSISTSVSASASVSASVNETSADGSPLGPTRSHLMDTRLMAVSNENGWKVPPPAYGYAITQPEYVPGMDWLSAMSSSN